jgi:hypothetical protein
MIQSKKQPEKINVLGKIIAEGTFKIFKEEVPPELCVR